MNKLKVNKKVIIIISTVLLVIVIAVGITYVVLSNTNKGSKQTTAQIKDQANTLKAQAAEAIKTNNTASAKSLLEQAQQKYQAANDTNNSVDTAAQLYLLEHPSKTTTSTSTSK